LPAALVGESSIATRVRSRAMRDGLSERTTRLLERASATTLKRCEVSAPGAAACGASANRRFTISATSSAEACASGITTGSPPPGWSIESMILARRCRLSA